MDKPETHALIRALLAERVVSRIWERDASVWSGGGERSPEEADRIRQRLGWLDAPETMRSGLDAMSALARELGASGMRSVLLLGMGGSSLCAEVLREARDPEALDVRVLDTTDGLLIRDAARSAPEETLHLVASKSGTTVEVRALEAFFYDRAAGVLGARAGAHFVAITDPGTPLERHAADRRYRVTFTNPADIGGRFSVLSHFGLVPAALMGISLQGLLADGRAMASACRQEDADNPGLALGAALASAALAGRDKLTLLLPPALAPLGLWIEQLVAESTGKRGLGLLPIVDEPPGPAHVYADDRVFVAVSDGAEATLLAGLEPLGHPVIRISAGLESLGREFFRWEFATAVAGAALGINPFDEPDVDQAKRRSREMLDTFVARGSFPDEPLQASDPEVEIYGGPAGTSPAAVLRAHIASPASGDYVAFLSYLPGSAASERVITDARIALQTRRRLATTQGVGPRYLHSTGQYHKGGPDRIIAVILTGGQTTETPVPGAAYTFETLRHAQALGDFQALSARGRRVVRVHIRSGADPPVVLTRLFGEALA